MNPTGHTVPFPVFTNGESLQFQFAYKQPHSPSLDPTPQTFTLMALTSNEDVSKVDIAGTTNTLDLNVTNSTHTTTLDVSNITNTSALNVDKLTTTTAFKMPTGAGLNKAMLSDGDGVGIWTDMNPFLDRYWSFAIKNNDLFSHGRNVGIGTTADDVEYY